MHLVLVSTNHEALVPGFDLLFREVSVVHQELHVLLWQFLASCHAHLGCLPSQQQQQQQQQCASVDVSHQGKPRLAVLDG